MRAVRLLYPLKQVAASPFPPVGCFSSCSGVNTKSTNCFPTDANEGQSVHKYSRKFKWYSANFVGSVEQPLKVVSGNGNTLGAWTFLRVKVSPESNSSFRIVLKLWEKMAESYLERLKSKDFIYVAGTLESYKKADKRGKSNLCYELTVSELNYIEQYDQGSRRRNSEGMRHEEDEARKEKYRERLHLWQVFFSNPHEWWDNRKTKPNPRHPDFRHKSTGEALWLHATDPTWIRKQLELLDAKAVEKYQDGHFGSDSSISKLLYY